MKGCPICSREFRDIIKLCPFDGTPLESLVDYPKESSSGNIQFIKTGSCEEADEKLPTYSIFVQALRWICILPVGVLCIMLVPFPIHWIVELIQIFGKASDDSFISIDGKTPLAAISPVTLEIAGYAIFIPCVVVIFGAWVAPKFRLQVGIALGILWMIGFSVAVAFNASRWVISLYFFNGANITWSRLVIALLLHICGIGIGLRFTYTVYTAENGGDI